jgi:uncharacterized protein YegJ (DUF2314 family)
MTKQRLATLAVVLLSLVGCKDKKSDNPPEPATNSSTPARHVGDRVKRETNPTVEFYGKGDVEMNAAIADARKTVEKFIAAWQSPKTGQVSFFVKAGFVDGKKVEHMWLSQVQYDGTQFTGTVANEPLDLKNVKLGDSRTVLRDMISDWMFVENGHLVGGYTLRVERKHMTEEERAKIDELFTVDD